MATDLPPHNLQEVVNACTMLFAPSELERSYRVNIDLIGAHDRPGARNLRDLLEEWLEWFTRTTRRRFGWRQGKGYRPPALPRPPARDLPR